MARTDDSDVEGDFESVSRLSKFFFGDSTRTCIDVTDISGRFVSTRGISFNNLWDSCSPKSKFEEMAQDLTNLG